jgi:hypothetical protein
VLKIEGESLAQLLRRQAGGKGMRLSALGHRGFHCHLKLRALLGRQLRKVRVGHRQSPHGLNGHRGLPEAWFHVGSNVCRMHREKGQRARGNAKPNAATYEHRGLSSLAGGEHKARRLWCK